MTDRERIPPRVGGGRVYGYARVSSADQNLERQREVLHDVDLLVEEKASGAGSRHQRAELSTLLRYIYPGDTLRVKSIDRLARTTVELLAIVDELADRGVKVEFIDTPQLNVTSKEGRAMLTIFAAFAQLEREGIKERQREGIEVAKKAGKYRKQARLTIGDVARARQLVATGVPKARIARELGVSRPTLYDALAGRGVYADGGSRNTDDSEIALE
ncbi:recombinase family protein [Corynebacterium glyciniphilum]|uniref:recombinase family protein n=1 Tax=Corynebacterium glyciniphilum TaxID=1404244 RepID=UPI001D0F072C|nr:recombinase family protein [Corynebacterium glyciniphilum]